MKKTKMVASGLAGLGVVYGLWRGWETGVEAAWRHGFGSPDLGAVDFATLERRATPNDALACPRDFCPKAKPDFEPPVFPVSAERLRVIVSDIALSEPDTMLIQSGPTQERYLVRTRLMRFPDTVVAQVIERGEDQSTIALYSRSQIGRSDFGVNGGRIRRWVDQISQRVAQSSSGH